MNDERLSRAGFTKSYFEKRWEEKFTQSLDQGQSHDNLVIPSWSRKGSRRIKSRLINLRKASIPELIEDFQCWPPKFFVMILRLKKGLLLIYLRNQSDVGPKKPTFHQPCIFTNDYIFSGTQFFFSIFQCENGIAQL